MKAAITVTSLLCAALLGCASPPTQPSTSDWIRASDGSYTHRPSGALCAVEIEGFALKGVRIPETQGSLGTCDYADGAGRVGEIRVRRYMPGVGETPLAIQGDETLMKGTVSGDPSQELVSTSRVGPGPEIDGAPTQRNVITVKRNGLLIDCAAWEKQTQFAEGSLILEFAINCQHMPGG
jgi:hypothetical protein